MDVKKWLYSNVFFRNMIAAAPKTPVLPGMGNGEAREITITDQSGIRRPEFAGTATSANVLSQMGIKSRQ
jgi:hypothetical protein